MEKRTRGVNADDAAGYRKAPKCTRREDKTSKERSGLLSVEPIVSARQLQQLLSRYDDPTLLRNGIQSFRVFLESIASSENSATALSKLRPILREYLESQRPKNESEEEAIYMADMMQAWGLASQSNNNSLLSAIPSVLGLLLRTISHIEEFRLHGIRLCKTVVQQAQLTLIHRGLSATYEFVLASHLCLLTEVVSFDGGSQAKAVYTHREFTFKCLGKHLNWTLATGKSGQGKKKQSIRDIAIEFLLTNFKYQNAAAKSDLVEQRNIISALLTNIREDSPGVVVEILNVLKQYFILDGSVQRSAKSRLLTSWALSRFATLYGYTTEFSDSGNKTIDAVAHEFLKFVCTTPDHGVLLPESGWYPAGSDLSQNSIGTDVQNLKESDPGYINIGFDYSEDYKKYQDKVPVRNATLSAFILGLRPYANTLQSELLLAIFKAAPELVADYFFKNRSFSFEAKLTPTWIGHSAFLFSTVQLPVPVNCGRRDGFSSRPPPISIVMESILPRPLSQNVLTKCLNQNTKLVRFFAVRLLYVAFQKLEAVLEAFRLAYSKGFVSWEHALENLVREFCRRCPKMRDVITVFRSTEEKDILQREAVARLLASYYRATPEMAVNEKFDVSVALANALKHIETEPRGELGNADEADSGDREGEEADFPVVDSTEVLGMRMTELEHLLYIAQCSPNIRWWNKPDSLPLTTFTSLLKLLVEAPTVAPLLQIKSLLKSIVRRTQHLQQETSGSSLDALTRSLRPEDDRKLSDGVLQFLDNSIVRYARSSIKYYDEFVSLVSEEYDDQAGVVEVQPVSLLLLTLVEQWQFLDASKVINLEDKWLVAEWLTKYLESSVKIGENRTILIKLCKRLANATKSDQQLKSLLEDFRIVLNQSTNEYDVAGATGHSPDAQMEHSPHTVRSGSSDLHTLYPLPPMNYEDLIQKLDNDTGDSVNVCLFEYVIDVYNDELSKTQRSSMKNWCSRVYVWLTKNLSIYDNLSDTVKKLCRRLSGAFTDRDLRKLSDPALLNALLESILKKHIDKPITIHLAASIASRSIILDLNYRFLLQLLLNHKNNPLREDRSQPTKVQLTTIYLIGRLFHANPESQANPATLQQILTLARGSYDIIDAVLESVCTVYIRAGGKSFIDQASSFSISDEEGRALFRYANNKLQVNINPKRLNQSMSYYPARSTKRIRGLGLVPDFLREARDFKEIFSDLYSPFFIHKIIINWLSSEDGLVDPATVIESNCAGFVIMGLTSPDRTGRMIALEIVETLIAKLTMSNYSEKYQVIFLLRGLVYTTKKIIDKYRLPTSLAVFAAKALIIQTDPLHCLYPKVNEFLLQGPTWEASKVPLFHSILLREPQEDDSYYKEVAWMIENLKCGLSTPEDLNTYRRNHYFEHLLSMYWSPYLPEPLKHDIYRVLFKVVDIDGGGTTLITRTGIVDWIDLAKEAVAKPLAKIFYDDSDQHRIDSWSNGLMAERVQKIDNASVKRT